MSFKHYQKFEHKQQNCNNVIPLKYDSSDPPPLDLDSNVDTDDMNGGLPLFDSLDDDDDEDYYEGDLDIDSESDGEEENGSGHMFDDVNNVDDTGTRISDSEATIYDDIRNRYDGYFKSYSIILFLPNLIL